MSIFKERGMTITEAEVAAYHGGPEVIAIRREVRGRTEQTKPKQLFMRLQTRLRSSVTMFLFAAVTTALSGCAGEDRGGEGCETSREEQKLFARKSVPLPKPLPRPAPLEDAGKTWEGAFAHALRLLAEQKECEARDARTNQDEIDAVVAEMNEWIGKLRAEATSPGDREQPDDSET